jgi:cytochrome c5
MRKLAAAAALAIAAAAPLAGCGTAGTSSPPPAAAQASHGTPTAGAIAQQMGLSQQAGYTVYNAATDPNHLLGRQNGYTSKASWGGYTAQPETTTGVAGGSIEVFPAAEAMQERLSYLRVFTAPFGDGYDYSAGTAILRLSAGYTPAQAAALRALFSHAA